MRVAFDAACFRLDRAGTARAAAGLLGALVAMAEPPSVALLGDGPPVDRGTMARRLTVLDQDLAWYGHGLATAARRAGADVLHCPTFRGPLTRPAQRLVVTVLDLAVLREPGWFPRWSRSYGAFAVPRVVRSADRVICASQATADDVSERLGVVPERLRLVPLGIDPLFSEPPGPSPLAGPYVLAVATHEPRKNLDRVLAAHRLRRARGAPETLALVGGGGWGGVRLAPEDAVAVLGRVGDVRLRDLYAHASATVVASLWEGFGLPAGEALATGCPLACSDIPALREVAGEVAAYCDPLSSESIADAVDRAVSGPRPAPRRELTWERTAAGTLDVWRELA
jgi:glycosyltransferase involved in cell wall biosynthesis